MTSVNLLNGDVDGKGRGCCELFADGALASWHSSESLIEMAKFYHMLPYSHINQVFRMMCLMYIARVIFSSSSSCNCRTGKFEIYSLFCEAVCGCCTKFSVGVILK